MENFINQSEQPVTPSDRSSIAHLQGDLGSNSDFDDARLSGAGSIPLDKLGFPSPLIEDHGDYFFVGPISPQAAKPPEQSVYAASQSGPPLTYDGDPLGHYKNTQPAPPESADQPPAGQKNVCPEAFSQLFRHK